MSKSFSLLMWLIGKYLDVKGFFAASIVFELVSKVSGRKQYMICYPCLTTASTTFAALSVLSVAAK